MKFWPFKLVKDENSDRILIEVIYKNEKKKLYIEEILALELKFLKKIATTYLNQEIEDAVISIPAYFNLVQRQIVKDAAHIAGLNCLRLVNDSVLSAITYTFEIRPKNEENILVFDFGAGHLNVALMALEDGLIETVSIGGNNDLGGEDFVKILMAHCINEFYKKTDIDIKSSKKAMRRIRDEFEKAKRNLSSSNKAYIDIDSLFNGEDLTLEITREKFEELCEPLFKHCLNVVENVLKDGKRTKSDIGEIILIGGSSRIPKIKSMLKEYFNSKEISQILNPQEAVAVGAAIQAAIVTDVNNDTISKLILLDVYPFPIGYETGEGIMSFISSRNSTFPLTKYINASTTKDNQTSISLGIFEGENQLCKDN